jgi:hypothetical protein
VFLETPGGPVVSGKIREDNEVAKPRFCEVQALGGWVLRSVGLHRLRTESLAHFRQERIKSDSKLSKEKKKKVNKSRTLQGH